LTQAKINSGTTANGKAHFEGASMAFLILLQCNHVNPMGNDVMV
jgi:hypothetical protein